MAKWADYLISQVSYSKDHVVSVAIRHSDSEKGISTGTPIDRMTIISDIKNGITYLTIFQGKNTWLKGDQIRTFSISGNPFLRIDGNRVELDNLGQIPEVKKELLDKFSQNEIIVQLKIDEQKSSDTEKNSQLINELKLESLPVTQVTEEIKPEPPRPTTKGSLPMETDEELPQELDLAPEPVTEETTLKTEELQEEPEEEATPEQLLHLENLQKQIDELEDKISSQEITLKTEELEEEPEEEATPEQLLHLENIQKQIDELEISIKNKNSTNQSSEFKTEKTKIQKSNSDKIDSSIKQQSKKLDDIQNKINPKISTSSSVEVAYCVKCKTKREIKEPIETVMKNGRSAVKGKCSVCSCNVFRIGKLKK